MATRNIGSANPSDIRRKHTSTGVPSGTGSGTLPDPSALQNGAENADRVFRLRLRGQVVELDQADCVRRRETRLARRVPRSGRRETCPLPFVSRHAAFGDAARWAS